MDDTAKSWLRKHAGLVEQREAMGATELMVELRHLADKWAKSNSQGSHDEAYDQGCNITCHKCAEELLAVIEKHRKH